MRRAEYGYDAPYALMIFAAIGIVCAIGTAIAWRDGQSHTARMVAANACFFCANAVSFFYTTRRGKFVEWEKILDGLPIAGGEKVLDIGCGRGAVLAAVARRLKTGRITGVDIWSRKDQSGNSPDVTMRNMALEGVGDRVQIETADMRSLPFPDASFDLIVSSLAIHNISSNEDRKKAITEAFRVLKPNGKMVIADIRATGLYADTLRALNASNVTRRRLGWRFWWGNPIAATQLVTAAKQ